jgi:ABC-type Mn2+/Zn2+ transport system permease subunit
LIATFLESWELFQNAYLAGWLIAVVLAWLGVLVVARDQIFLGAAVSQASMLGITIGTWLGVGEPTDPHDPLHSGWLLSLYGGVFAVGAALLTVYIGGRVRESREAVTGWVFLVGVSFSVIIAAHLPHGLEEVYRILASTIIGATREDVAVLSSMAVASLVALLVAHRTILLVVTDPDMAAAVGVRVARWDNFLWLWLGLGVSGAIRIAGTTFTFGSLVLPALIAKHLCAEMRQMFIVAPIVGCGGAILAFILADSLDLPPGQMAVAVWSAMLALAWLRRTAD